MTISTKVLHFGKCRFRIESEQSELIEAIESLFLVAKPAVNRPVAGACEAEDEVIVERLVDDEESSGQPDNSASFLPVIGESSGQSDDLAIFLPVIEESSGQSGNEASYLPVIEESSGQSDDLAIFLPVIALVNRLYGRHSECIWLDAASLLSPAGRLVLLAGPSHSGKTTLSLALALAKCWSILSEDITLIDPQLKIVHSCPAPSKLRAGTAARLAEACHASVDMFPESAWFFDASKYVAEPLPAEFSVALYLDAIDENVSSDLSIDRITPAELVKLVLPISNLLKVTGKVDHFYETIETASCLKISGGKLSERIDLLERIVNNVD